MKIGQFKPATGAYSASSWVDPIRNIVEFVSNLIGWMTVGAGLFFIFQIIVAGIKWMSAGGNSGELDKARNQMIHATIGLVIVVASYGIIGVVSAVVGLDIINLRSLIESATPDAQTSPGGGRGGGGVTPPRGPVSPI